MNPTIKRLVEKVTGNLWGNKNEFDGEKFDHLTDVQKSRLGEFVREISLLTKEENAAKTYAELKRQYIVLKALLTSLGVNITELDIIKE